MPSRPTDGPNLWLLVSQYQPIDAVDLAVKLFGGAGPSSEVYQRMQAKLQGLVEAGHLVLTSAGFCTPGIAWRPPESTDVEF